MHYEIKYNQTELILVNKRKLSGTMKQSFREGCGRASFFKWLTHGSTESTHSICHESNRQKFWSALFDAFFHFFISCLWFVNKTPSAQADEFKKFSNERNKERDTLTPAFCTDFHGWLASFSRHFFSLLCFISCKSNQPQILNIFIHSIAWSGQKFLSTGIYWQFKLTDHSINRWAQVLQE